MSESQADYQLQSAKLKIEDGCLWRMDDSKNPIASVKLQDISGAKCRTSYNLPALIVGLGCLWLAKYFIFNNTTWYLQVTFGPLALIAGLLAIIGGIVETELRIKTIDGDLNIPILSEVADAKAFAMTLMRQAKELKGST